MRINFIVSVSLNGETTTNTLNFYRKINCQVLTMDYGQSYFHRIIHYLSCSLTFFEYFSFLLIYCSRWFFLFFLLFFLLFVDHNRELILKRKDDTIDDKRISFGEWTMTFDNGKAANNEDEANEELLEHLKIIDGINVEQPSLKCRLANAFKSLKFKEAMAHIGLMVSLSVYCVVGGIVSTIHLFTFYFIVTKNIWQNGNIGKKIWCKKT